MYSSRRNISLLNLLPSKDSSAKWVHLPFCCRTTFSEFAAKHAKDSRFKAIEKMKDREALFNEFITAARKKEKEDSKSRGEKVRRLLGCRGVSGASAARDEVCGAPGPGTDAINAARVSPRPCWTTCLQFAALLAVRACRIELTLIWEVKSYFFSFS